MEEPEEPGWGQLEPALNELPSNKRACKDDGDKGEESASKRPHPLTVDVVLPEPVNEVVQVTETRRRRRGPGINDLQGVLMISKQTCLHQDEASKKSWKSCPKVS